MLVAGQKQNSVLFCKMISKKSVNIGNIQSLFFLSGASLNFTVAATSGRSKVTTNGKNGSRCYAGDSKPKCF